MGEPSKPKFPGKGTEDEPHTVKHSECYDDVAGESTKEKQALQLQSLLDMESELEDAMCKIRKRMMVIRMIGLMSEDDALKDSLLQNSGKMIEFLNCTLHRAANVCKKRQARRTHRKNNSAEMDVDEDAPSKEDSNDVTEDEIQSLTTTLGLLRNMVVGSGDASCKYTKVETSDWDILQLGLEDLKVIENCHEEKSISFLAGKLRELISTNIAVMDHNKRIRIDTDSIRRKTEELKNKVQEFRVLLDQASNEASELAETTHSEEENHGASIVIPITEKTIIEDEASSAVNLPPIEGNEVLSLKSLASNIIK